MADVSYGSLPFAEQIAFFRRKVNLPTNAWTDIWQEAHDHAFVVAGANRTDLLAAFRNAIDKAIANGETLAQFRKRFDTIAAKHGWSYHGGRNWRSRVIYETNLRTSYAAGRYQQLQEVKKWRPYWQYVHADGELHPRPLHVAWDGMVLHADDPWWQAHYPPNGWGCQCTIHALNERDLKRLGKDAPDKAPPDDMHTVTVGKNGPTPRTVETPAGVDPGFGYTPGRDAMSSTDDLGVLRAPPGTPPIAGAIGHHLRAAFNGTDMRYAGLPEAQARALFEAERAIVSSAIELGRGIDANGNVPVAVTGTRTRLDLRAYREQLKGLVLTHNHPGEIGFSLEDVATAAAYGLAEIRVITNSALYRMSPVSGAPWPGELVVLSYASAPARVELVAQALAWGRQARRRWPRLSAAQIDQLTHDRLMLLLQRRYPTLFYRVIKP